MTYQDTDSDGRLKMSNGILELTPSEVVEAAINNQLSKQVIQTFIQNGGPPDWVEGAELKGALAELFENAATSTIDATGIDPSELSIEASKMMVHQGRKELIEGLEVIENSADDEAKPEDQ